jgi:hypothetical protein
VSERVRGDLGSVFKKAGSGRAHGHEQQCSPFIGQHGRRSGQANSDKYTGLGYARRVARSRRGRWREAEAEAGRLYRRESIDTTPARCSITCRLLEHDR